MKRTVEKQGKNSWNHIVGLFAFIHSVVALIVYEVLRFQPCDAGLFLGSCSTGIRLIGATIILSLIVFILLFSAVYYSSVQRYGNGKAIGIAYGIAVCVTICFLMFFHLSGVALVFLSF